MRTLSIAALFIFLVGCSQQPAYQSQYPQQQYPEQYRQQPTIIIVNGQRGYYDDRNVFQPERTVVDQQPMSTLPLGKPNYSGPSTVRVAPQTQPGTPSRQYNPGLTPSPTPSFSQQKPDYGQQVGTIGRRSAATTPTVQTPAPVTSKPDYGTNAGSIGRRSSPTPSSSSGGAIGRRRN